MKGILVAFCYTLCLGVSAQLEQIKGILSTKTQSEETVIWLCDTAYSFYMNDPLLSQQVAELALERANELNYELGKAKANHVLGVSYWARDSYDEAIEHYLDALKSYDILGDTRGKALISMNIGTIYDDLNESERGKGYLLRSAEMIRSIGDSVNLGKVYNNIATLYKRIDKIDSALFFYQACMAIRKELQDSIGVASIHNNIASLQLELNAEVNLEDATSAYRNLMLALQYLDPGDDSRLYSAIMANLGKSLIVLKRYTEAKAYLDQALTIAIQLDYKARQQLIYGYLRELSEAQGNYRLALEYYRQETILDHQQRNADVTKQIDELNIKYETAKREKLLAELERQKAVDQGIKNSLTIGVIAVILIAIMLIVYTYQKRKKDQLIARLQVQKLSDEVTTKNKEIASYTMSFLQKNQLMEELKEQINELKKSSDISTNKELTRINRIVDNTFRSDEEWKTFQVTFDQMHDGFFKDLKAAYPDISNAELKLCALLRLNMNLKESAKILGIAPDSVKTARYRLRKKLGLKTEENLIDFLIQFEKGQAG